MRKLLWFVAALSLSLSMVACRQPTDPSFSPDGRSLAYEKGGKLFLRSPKGLAQLTDAVEGPVAWSPDGKRLAFTARKSTTVLDLSSQSRRIVKGVSFPYWWKESELIGTHSEDGQEGASLQSINAFTGEAEPVANLDFVPAAIYPLSDSRALVTDGVDWYDLEGTACKKSAALDQTLRMAGVSSTGQPRLYRYRVPKGGTNWQIQLLDWDADAAHPPRPGEILDFTGLIPETIFGVSYEVKGGVQVALIAAIRPANRQDAERLTALIREHDLLNAMMTQPDATNHAVLDEVEQVVNRSDEALYVLVNSGSGWQILLRDVAKESQEAAVGVSPDGTQVAIVTNQGLRICRLRG